MPLSTCTLLTAKIRRLGQPPQRAKQLAWILVVEFILAAAASGMIMIPAFEQYNRIITYIINDSETHSNEIYYAPFGIHRQTPVL